MVCMIKLGISPINWSNDDDHSMGGDISFEQCLDEMYQAGFSGCEVGHKFPVSAKQLLKELAKRNLSIASKWFSAYAIDKQQKRNNISDFCDHLEFLSELGAKVVVVSECSYSVHSDISKPLAEKPVWNSEQWNKIYEYINLLGYIAKDYGLQLAYHQHIGTGVETEAELIKLLSNTNSDLVKLLLDTGHMYFAGIDINNVLNKYIDRIVHVHLKDIRKDVYNKIVSNKNSTSFLSAVKSGVFTVPGDGVIDFCMVINNLKKNNYEGWFVVEAEQDPAIANPLVYANKAFDYLSAMI